MKILGAVLFLLLSVAISLWFLSPGFRQPEGSLRDWLPSDRAAGGGSPSVDSACRLRLSLSEDGERVICRAGERVLDELDKSADDPRFPSVELYLREQRDADTGGAAKGLPVIIDFASEVPPGFVVAVINLCQKLEIDDVTFAAPEIPIER